MSVASWCSACFVLLCVFDFAWAILSWCPYTWHVYIVYNILSLNITSIYIITCLWQKYIVRRSNHVHTGCNVMVKQSCTYWMWCHGQAIMYILDVMSRSSNHVHTGCDVTVKQSCTYWMWCHGQAIMYILDVMSWSMGLSAPLSCTLMTATTSSWDSPRGSRISPLTPMCTCEMYVVTLSTW